MSDRYKISEIPLETQIKRTEEAISAATALAVGAATPGVKRYWESVEIAARKKLKELQALRRNTP